MNVVVYGNCQAGPIGRLLLRASPDLNLISLPAVHTLKDKDRTNVEEAFKNADAVLSQPIGSGFGVFSTASLKEVVGPKTWVTFPSIYFGGMFPYLTYLRQSPKTLQGPLGDYHDTRIIKGFLRGLTEEECVSSLSEYSLDACRSHFDAALAETSIRDADADLPFVPYLKTIMSEVKPFHTFNHPINYILWDVATRFLALIGGKVDPSATPPITQYLDAVSVPIPPEMQEIAGVKYVDDCYKLNRKDVAFSDLVRGFYAVYREKEAFPAICAKNGIAIA